MGIFFYTPEKGEKKLFPLHRSIQLCIFEVAPVSHDTGCSIPQKIILWKKNQLFVSCFYWGGGRRGVKGGVLHKQSVSVPSSPPAELAGAASATRYELASHSTDMMSASHPNQSEPTLYQVYKARISV